MLMGYCTPNQKLACFVLYLKIINTILKNNILSNQKLACFVLYLKIINTILKNNIL